MLSLIWVGMNRNSVSNYAGGDVPESFSGCIATLIAEMNVRGIEYRGIIKQWNLPVKAPPGWSKTGKFGGR